jgi:hypothetical protein
MYLFNIGLGSSGSLLAEPWYMTAIRILGYWIRELLWNGYVYLPNFYLLITLKRLTSASSNATSTPSAATHPV